MREGRPAGRTVAPLFLFAAEKRNDNSKLWREGSYIIRNADADKIRTFGHRKKFRKMAKNLLTGKGNRAIMYKLA